jgi:predicted DNA-binding transcriptional regulator AlpA
MAIRQKLITQAEAAQLTGRSRRSISTWIKEGMPTYPTLRQNKHVALVAESDVLEWSKKKNHGKPSHASTKPADPPALPPDLSEIMADLSGLSIDQIEATMDRVSRLEQAVHQAAFSTLHPDMIRTYKDVLSARRQLEKEIPEILYRKGRYVDVDIVGPRIAAAMAGVSTVLDSIGSTAAPLCEGKGVREIRAVIDGQMSRAKAMLQELLKQELDR